MHAGVAYSAEGPELSRQLREDFGIVPAASHSVGNHILGIAAPHVSPSGGVASYSAAYQRLAQEFTNRTFVILGTSHYGMPEKFGLTRKPYRTPLGTAEVDVELVDRLARKASDAVIMEDYCHAVEHSIEFQVVFLQHAVGPNVRILPILCGSLLDNLRTGRPPDSHADVARFVDALAELAASEGDRLFWVLGVDMAHMGARYGDGVALTAGEGRMQQVSAQDTARIERLCAGDTEGFVRLVQANQDDLKWCGYAPFYVFLRTMGYVRAEAFKGVFFATINGISMPNLLSASLPLSFLSVHRCNIDTSMKRLQIRQLVLLLSTTLMLLSCMQSAAPQPQSGNTQIDRDLTEVSITALQSMYASGKYSVTQVTQWHLDRIARYDGVYKSFLHVDSAGALATARAEDAAKRTAGASVPSRPAVGHSHSGQREHEREGARDDQRMGRLHDSRPRADCSGRCLGCYKAEGRRRRDFGAYEPA